MSRSCWKATRRPLWDSVPWHRAGLGCSGPARQPEPQDGSSIKSNESGDVFPSPASCLPNPGLVPKQLSTRQVLVPNLRPKIYHGSTLGFLPTARIPPSLTPRLLQTSPPVKTPKTMIKLDKASRDEIINRWDREGSRSLIFMLAPIRFL